MQLSSLPPTHTQPSVTLGRPPSHHMTRVRTKAEQEKAERERIQALTKVCTVNTIDYRLIPCEVYPNSTHDCIYYKVCTLPLFSIRYPCCTPPLCSVRYIYAVAPLFSIRYIYAVPPPPLFSIRYIYAVPPTLYLIRYPCAVVPLFFIVYLCCTPPVPNALL